MFENFFWGKSKRQEEIIKPVYQDIFPPFYNIYAELESDEPEIYNKFREKIHTFFIRDKTSSHLSSQWGNYILWDRYNFGLKTHFYTHDSLLETMGSPVRKYGAFIETKAISPSSYQIFDKYKGLQKDFDFIFTYDEGLLNKLDNSKFVPFCAQIKLDFANYIDLDSSKILMNDDMYKNKNKNISLLSSNKKMCDLHKLRIDIAKRFEKSSVVDTYGTFNGGAYIRSFDTLKNYRYSIVFENEISAYCFTEKLTNCFATQTVPIYVGATKIQDYFNMDGIIQISIQELDNLDSILRQCSVQDYEARINAILDNYQRSKNYLNVQDNMFKTYIENML